MDIYDHGHNLLVSISLIKIYVEYQYSALSVWYKTEKIFGKHPDEQISYICITE